MKKIFKVKEKCKSCDGTGLYVGIAERDGFAVVCSTCKGTGCHEFIHEYEEFTKRKLRDNVKKVLKCNPGITVGEGNNFKLDDFGGISYSDFLKFNVFPVGTEMRKFVCPCWWYQSADYKLKPDWDECIGVGVFSNCDFFHNKNKCWDRFDKENT